jgi:hypothetical protein
VALASGAGFLVALVARGLVDRVGRPAAGSLPA